MRIIHCADIHLGSKMGSNLPDLKAKERKKELFDNFIKLIEYANVNEINHIIIAGDLFDFVKGNVLLVNKTIDVFRKYHNISFYYLEGNHDEKILNGIDLPENLFIFGKDFKKYTINNIVIGGMTEINANAVQFDSEKFNILLLHGNVINHKNGTKEDIYLNNFKNKNINYIALGHIHKNMEYKIDEKLIANYSGCLEGRGFDETGLKGFYIIDIDENAISNFKYNFVPFSSRILHEVKVDLTGCADYNDIIELLKQKLVVCSSNDLVKVVLVGEYDINLDKNLELVEKRFVSNYYFFKIVDESKLKIYYNDYVDEISILGEFVRTVLKEEQLENKDEILTLGIKSLRGDDL